MKTRFKYYMHDDYTGTERAEAILEQTNLDMTTEELSRLIGRPFYEVELTCELDTKTGKVTVLRTKL